MTDTLKCWVAERRSIAEAATPGPWKSTEGDYVGFLGQCFFNVAGGPDFEDSVAPGRVTLENARAIADARNCMSIHLAALEIMDKALCWVMMNSGVAADGNHVDPIEAHAENFRRLDEARADVEALLKECT